MKIRLIAALVAIFLSPAVVLSGECTAQFTAGILDAGKVLVKTHHTLTARLVNSSSDTIYLRGVKIAQNTEIFTVENASSGVIPPKSNRDFIFTAFSLHNLIYTAVAFAQLRCSVGEYSLPITLTAEFIYPDSTYNFTQNLVGSALATALSLYLQPQTSYTYKQAREYMWGSIDNRNGTVECVYTGRIVSTKGIPDASKFNTEHTWPQSKGSDTGPANTDLFHLYPTWAPANSARSNNPFGIVAQSIYWQDGGSKAGFVAIGKNDSIFEPRNTHKGNVARSMFYYCTRYGNRQGTYDKEGFLTVQEDVLREWNNLDTVDAAERARNEAIYALQKRRNPYIDHPEFIERINKLSAQRDFPPYPRLAASDERVIFSFYGSDDQERELSVYVANTGTEDAMIVSASVSPDTDSNFTVTDITPKELTVANWTRIKIRAKRPKTGNIDGTLKIRFADGLPSIPIAVSATASQPSAIEESSLAQEQITQITDCTPHPVLDEATVAFSVPEYLAASARIIFYAPNGRLLADVTPNIIRQNGYSYVKFHRYDLPTGFIIVRLLTSTSSDARIIILE